MKLSMHESSFIDGDWRKSGGSTRFSVINPTTLDLVSEVVSSSEADVDTAVAAASGAFESWATSEVEYRAELLQSLFAELETRADDIALSITEEVGSTISLSRSVQSAAAIGKFDYYAQLVAGYQFTELFDSTPVVKEAIGIVACITPWNFPLLQIAAKVAPALAAGCTVVLKPSELAPTNAIILAECVQAAGFPAGVFNLVWGEGSGIGEYLVAHPQVDMVSFTGSTAAGRRIAAAAGQTIKRTAMELGGKSAAILLDDADFETAIAGVLETCFVNSGQSCTAHSRMIVPSARKAEALEIVGTLAQEWTVGDPMQLSTRMGPVISEAHWGRVQQYIEEAENSGATLITGGSGKPPGFDTGLFVKPTVFADVQADDKIAQEEVFGPVLAVLTANNEDEAVEIANNSIYGLSGGVWSADQKRALGIAHRMRTGTVEINGGTFNGSAPFGGYKQSGLGREMGPYGFEEFLQLKTLQV